MKANDMPKLKFSVFIFTESIMLFISVANF